MSQQQETFLGPFHLSRATVTSTDEEDTGYVTIFNVLSTFTMLTTSISCIL